MIELLPEEIPNVSTPEEQRIVNAYNRLLQGPDWIMVKKDLLRKFQMNRPALTPDSKGNFCALRAAQRSGMYCVLLHISTRLLQPAQGDANIEEVKPRIKK